MVINANHKLILALACIIMPICLNAQQHNVTGIVTSSEGEPLIGVAVMEQGTQNAVSTDMDGKYSINVKSHGSILEFIYVGCEDKIITVGNQSVINVSLDESILQLNDVVVIGYGTTTKKEITGSVSNLKSEDFLTGNISSPYDLIQGKIAGLNIIRTDGSDPNGGFSISLRGTTTMSAGAEPLIIIDDVIGGSLDSIDPEEIESIDVLKDGSAAAIYGTRGTNGVILITTKRGGRKDQC